MEKRDLQEKGNWVLILAAILTLIGLIMLLDISSVIPPQSERKPYYLFIKQLTWASIGFLCIFLILKRNITWWSRYLPWFFICSLLLLSLTIFFPSTKSVKRWILHFQPSEFVRVFFIFYLCKFFSQEKPTGFIKTLIPPEIFLGIIVVILVSQPHFSMSIFFCLLTSLIFFRVGVKKRYILTFFLILSCFIGAAILGKAYPLKRINDYRFKNKEWQIKMAEIALGAGGIGGVGLGESMQKLSCLPIPHSDFIFAILAEEGGFFSTLILFALFALFAYFGFSVAYYSSSTLNSFLAFSLVLSIVLQAIINIAVVSNVLPTMGLPLPFLSYGGSFLISNLISVGFIINVAKEG